MLGNLVRDSGDVMAYAVLELRSGEQVEQLKSMSLAQIQGVLDSRGFQNLGVVELDEVLLHYALDLGMGKTRPGGFQRYFSHSIRKGSSDPAGYWEAEPAGSKFKRLLWQSKIYGGNAIDARIAQATGDIGLKVDVKSGRQVDANSGVQVDARTSIPVESMPVEENARARANAHYVAVLTHPELSELVLAAAKQLVPDLNPHAIHMM